MTCCAAIRRRGIPQSIELDLRRNLECVCALAEDHEEFFVVVEGCFVPGGIAAIHDAVGCRIEGLAGRGDLGVRRQSEIW